VSGFWFHVSLEQLVRVVQLVELMHSVACGVLCSILIIVQLVCILLVYMETA